MNAPQQQKPVDEAKYRKWTRIVVLGSGVLWLPLLCMAAVCLKDFARLMRSGGMTEESGEALAGVAFGLILGLGIPIGLYFAFAKSWPYFRNKQLHPEEPWMWRAEWAKGKIPYSRRANAVALWIGGVVFSILVFGLVIGFADLAADFGVAPVWLYGVAVAGTAWVVVLALIETQRWKKFRTSYCHLNSNPGVLGGWLRTTLEIPVALRPGEAVHVVLKLSFTSQKKGKSQPRTVWQLERTISHEEMRVEPRGVTFVPVEFFIPKDVGVDMDSVTWGSHTWQLEASAGLMGLDYAARFEVPVFKTGESRDDVPPEAIALFGDTVDTAKDYHAPEHVRVTPVEGGIEIGGHAPTASQYAMNCVGIVIVLAVSVGVVAWMRNDPSPLKYVVYIVAGLMTLGFLRKMYSRRTVLLTREAVVRTSRVLFYTRRKRVPIADVREVWIEATQRPSGGERYRVDIKTKDSPPVHDPDEAPSDKPTVHWHINIGGITVADNIENRTQAEWLKRLLESYLFPRKKQPPPLSASRPKTPHGSGEGAAPS